MRHKNHNNPVYGFKYTAWAAGNRALEMYRHGAQQHENPYPPGSPAAEMWNKVWNCVELEVLLYGEEIY